MIYVSGNSLHDSSIRYEQDTKLTSLCDILN